MCRFLLLIFLISLCNTLLAAATPVKLQIGIESNLARYTGALLTIRGDQDFLPARDPQWLKLAPTDDKAFILMGGADHIFHVLDDPQTAHSAQLLNHTADWFERTL